MALYKIGVTEAGDAGVDLSWEEKLDDVDAAVLITKCVSPDFFDATLRHKDKLIIHTTVTGYGHSILEPNVPIYMRSLQQLWNWSKLDSL